MTAALPTSMIASLPADGMIRLDIFCPSLTSGD